MYDMVQGQGDVALDLIQIGEESDSSGRVEGVLRDALTADEGTLNLGIADQGLETEKTSSKALGDSKSRTSGIEDKKFGARLGSVIFSLLSETPTIGKNLEKCDPT